VLELKHLRERERLVSQFGLLELHLPFLTAELGGCFGGDFFFGHLGVEEGFLPADLRVELGTPLTGNLTSARRDGGQESAQSNYQNTHQGLSCFHATILSLGFLRWLCRFQLQLRLVWSGRLLQRSNDRVECRLRPSRAVEQQRMVYASPG